MTAEGLIQLSLAIGLLRALLARITIVTIQTNVIRSIDIYVVVLLPMRKYNL
jgi:hypothetical protein